MDWVGNRISRLIGLGFPERQFGYFALFVLVLGHSESELHSVYFIRSDSERNFLKNFQNFSQSFGLVENGFKRLCKTAHGQPPILACFSLESIMACS